MTTRKPRLELTWIGKDERPRLEPRILLEDPALSYHAAKRVTENDIFDNMLIHGDNLLALKALEQEFAGKVKCIYIDPPYNTGNAFEHYDDGLEHSVWLSLMRDRLELLSILMTEDGSIWINIDWQEGHYLKVMCDEIFGRSNFIAEVIWQKRTSRENRAAIGSSHDTILVYGKVPPVKWKESRNPLPESSKQASNPDNDPRGPWDSIPFTAQGWRPNQMYKITTPTGVVHDPPTGRCWGATEVVYDNYLREGRVYFPKSGDGKPRIKQYLSERKGLVPMSLWLSSEVGTTEDSKKEILQLFSGEEPFGTPKPEKLIQRVIQVATDPGDLVLDSFAGSGTTGAVAHKMGRRWIMVELGEHCHTHIVPRLRKVIDGEDPGGVTKTCNWQGGGGFRFFRLAPSLLEKDKWGNWIVSKEYRPEMLAEAMCKLEGFHYAPDSEVFWIHGKSTERDFIYVTTQNLSHEQLTFISHQVGEQRTLLICCSAFRARQEDFPNLTLKKIPCAVMSRCEWGRDDYSLNVEELPPVQAIEEAKVEVTANGSTKAEGTKATSGGRRKKASAMQDLPLFAGLADDKKGGGNRI
ncbi:MAG: DNA methylase N-4 [Deltaproteobacteria bacterium RIFOXYA12_FULL_61_11]|nr:MAG: DNA methylase N-4 [Deltaproteobacteria bacterium RIFOXYA12_FULL_61_11]